MIRFGVIFASFASAVFQLDFCVKRAFILDALKIVCCWVPILFTLLTFLKIVQVDLSFVITFLRHPPETTACISFRRSDDYSPVALCLHYTIFNDFLFGAVSALSGDVNHRIPKI